jgi:DnaJ-class molecular chaperone
MELNHGQTPFTVTHPTEIVPRRSPLIDEFFSMYSLADDFFGEFQPGFFDRGRKTRAPEKDLYLEVILSREEASIGGLLPIAVPVIEPRPKCEASGMREGSFCPACSGKGALQSERQFSLTIQPRTVHGTEVRISLDNIGLKDTVLNITVSIDPTLDYY